MFSRGCASHWLEAPGWNPQLDWRTNAEIAQRHPPIADPDFFRPQVDRRLAVPVDGPIWERCERTPVCCELASPLTLIDCSKNPIGPSLRVLVRCFDEAAKLRVEVLRESRALIQTRSRRGVEADR